MNLRFLLVPTALVSFVLAPASRGAVSAARAPEDSLHVEAVGAGDPVVLVPWLVGGGYGFRNVTALLQEAGYRTIVVEPLGVGGSGRPCRADYSLDAQSERVAAALDRLAVREAVIVGHGVGAGLAYRIAASRPELVRGIVSIEGGVTETAATPGLRRAMRLAGLLKLFVSRKKIRSRMREGMLASSADPAWVTPETVERYAAPATADPKRAIDVLAAIAKSRERRSLRDRLPAIRCPVEILIGGAPHQGSIDPAELSVLRDSIPEVTVTRVPDAGYFIQEERPQAIRSAVDRLDRATRAAPSDGGVSPAVGAAL